ncbi:SDR family oxidoreductase [Rathayibacter toxicus]|uniref:Dehydrogenase n=2 Tax=Rathayibacter toxicus TaxID=145458 RepID=A0A0C5BQ91_9MICO|nr:SDR family oxidoreductase [Rathayibacter toxicus]AJM76807.1 dehydrogenase [Rathayibacter toxicus]ALS57433.1 NAD(P)-dependent oxidoreductase [Rathayibacter toxicus]KKM44460.1 dehydrogenase [Rathayibacter toxicus]PPG20902.1 KR domain-containing protein [Rathayibacter toxicus]PPG46006.1 KR domain-containing protein [Rathayibacter toxicus]
MTPESPQQTPPGTETALTPKADHGETSYRGANRLNGKVALITGADSGIGKAVALAFAREGADVAISYLCEHEDAEDTARWVRDAGREALLLPGDLRDPRHCRSLITETVNALGHLEVIVSNAAFQMTYQEVTDIPDEEWDRTIATNLSAYFHLVKAALPHLEAGASIIATSSVQSDQPSSQLLPYAATKAAILNLTGSFAQVLGEKGIRANAVAPGPIWTPLIPSTMQPEAVATFGEQVPLGRPGQPAEVAHAYVLLASDDASYMSGSTIAVTGGKPIL